MHWIGTELCRMWRQVSYPFSYLNWFLLKESWWGFLILEWERSRLFLVGVRGIEKEKRRGRPFVIFIYSSYISRLPSPYEGVQKLLRFPLSVKTLQGNLIQGSNFFLHLNFSIHFQISPNPRIKKNQNLIFFAMSINCNLIYGLCSSN